MRCGGRSRRRPDSVPSRRDTRRRAPGLGRLRMAGRRSRRDARASDKSNGGSRSASSTKTSSRSRTAASSWPGSGSIAAGWSTMWCRSGHRPTSVYCCNERADAVRRRRYRAAARAKLPLAARLRPRTIDDVVGQRHLLGPGKPLRRLVETDTLSSVLLWGPPGTGKTTLALAVAGSTSKEFEQLSAVTAGVKDVREVIERARQRLGEHDRGTILFLDEIHRFNKAQQDALLPAVEDGTLTLIGATTENPFFEVNPPLRSRSTLFRLEPLDHDSLRILAAAWPRCPPSHRGAGGHHPDHRALWGRRTPGADVCRGRRRPRPSWACRPRPTPRRHSRRAPSATAATTTTTSSARSSSRCVDPTPTLRCIGSHACSKRARTRASSPGGWSSSPARTSVWPIPRHWWWPSPPPMRWNSSACRKPS